LFPRVFSPCAYCLFVLNTSLRGFSLSFSLDEKETKNQGKNMLPRALGFLNGLRKNPAHKAQA
jgi:hypothetical protein